MSLEPSQPPAAALDRAAFGRLFDEYLPRLYAYVGGRIDDRESAEAITAAAFHRAVEVARTEGLDGAAFPAFLFRVAASAIVDHGRRARATYPGGVRAADFDRDADFRRSAVLGTEDLVAKAFVAGIDRRALRRAIQGLPESQQRLIVLRHLDALTVDEQGAVLGWSRETLARRVNATLRSVRAALAEEAIHAA